MRLVWKACEMVRLDWLVSRTPVLELMPFFLLAYIKAQKVIKPQLNLGDELVVMDKQQ